MKAKTFGITAIVVATLTTIMLYGQSQAVLQGTAPYTPSRIEWLTVELNAFARLETLDTDRFRLAFTLKPNEDKIVIQVRYLPEVERANMNSAIDAARNVVNILARQHAWDAWLRIEEDLAPMQTGSE